MAYGTVKVDNVTFTYNAADATTTFSGFYASTTNNLTLSGTASANTFTGSTANFTNANAQNISVTTLLSGLAITGGTAGFTTVTGTTVTGTTANFVTVSGTTVTGTTANFVTVSGTTVTGTTAQFTSITGGTAGFTTVTGTTVTGTTANFVTVSGTTTTGTTANFVSGVFTTQVSGATIIAPTGTFTSLTGTTTTMTSGVFALGTEPLPSISFASDPNTGIFSPGLDQVAISTNGVERVRLSSTGEFMFKGAGTTPGTDKAVSFNGSAPANSIVLDSSGRLGIGTTTVSDKLHVAAGNITLSYANGSTGVRNKIIWRTEDPFFGEVAYIAADRTASSFAPTDIVIATGTSAGVSEKCRITSDGRLLVGTSTARSNFFNTTITPGFQFESASDPRLSIVSNSSADAFSSQLILAHQQSGAAGGNTAVNSASAIGLISFQGSDGTNFVEAARIIVEADGTPGASDMPGRLVFSTTPDGLASPTERMRINSSGSVSIGTVGAKLDLLSSGNISSWGQGIRIGHDITYHAAVLVNGDSNFDRMYLDFHTSTAAAATLRARLTDRFYCDVTTITAFTSERRYKQNIDVAPLIPVDCWTVARDLPIHTYEYKNNPGSTTYGPIVDEIESIDISLILDTGKEDEEGSVHTYDNGRLQAMYQVALQEALKRIEQLESKVAALEGA